MKLSVSCKNLLRKVIVVCYFEIFPIFVYANSNQHSQNMSENTNSAIISEGMTVTRGAITNKNGLTIFGKVLRSSVTSLSEVVIEESGVLEGRLLAQSFDVKGKFSGSAIVRGTVTLRKGCFVKGAIDCGSIIIEEGAVISDSTHTLGEKLILDKLRADKVYCELEKAGSRVPEPAVAKQ